MTKITDGDTEKMTSGPRRRGADYTQCASCGTGFGPSAVCPKRGVKLCEFCRATMSPAFQALVDAEREHEEFGTVDDMCRVRRIWLHAEESFAAGIRERRDADGWRHDPAVAA